MATLPRFDIEMDTPRVSYIGNFDTLPEVSSDGNMASHNGRTFIYRNGFWIELADLVPSGGNLVDDLMEVLDRYKNNSLAKDILDLIETYKVCGYE